MITRRTRVCSEWASLLFRVWHRILEMKRRQGQGLRASSTTKNDRYFLRFAHRNRILKATELWNRWKIDFNINNNKLSSYYGSPYLEANAVHSIWFCLVTYQNSVSTQITDAFWVTVNQEHEMILYMSGKSESGVMVGVAINFRGHTELYFIQIVVKNEILSPFVVICVGVVGEPFIIQYT